MYLLTVTVPGRLTRLKGQLLLVEMVRRVRPDLVGHSVRVVRQPGRGLSHREGGSLGVGEQVRLAPGRDLVQPLVGLTVLQRRLDPAEHARGAAVDLAGPQVHELQDLAVRSGLADRLVDVLDPFGGVRQDLCGVGHPCLHGRFSVTFWQVRGLLPSLP